MPEDTTVNAGAGSEMEPGNGNGAGDGSDNGNPGQPNGTQPAEDWEAKYNEVLGHNKALNKKLVDAMRQANANKGTYKPGQVNDQGTEVNQDFLTAAKVAESDLRSGLDDIIDLYPELPANIVKLIRSNPWAFSSRDSYMSLNVPNALLDIETWMSNYVSGTPADGGEGQPATPATAPSKLPKNQVKPNQPSEDVPEQDIVPGSPEDNNPWTMPLDKLNRSIHRKYGPKN